MMNEHELRERLGEIPVPTSRLNTAVLVAAGRKRARRRSAARAGCGAALAVGLLIAVPSVVARAGHGGGRDAPAPAAASGPKKTVSCPVTELAMPAGMKAVQTTEVDPTGRYIIGNDITPSTTVTKDGKATMAATRPVLWTDGTAQALPVVGNVRSVLATSVNAGGVVVAVAGQKTYDSIYRYVGGVPVKLTAPIGKWTYRVASVNAAGDVLATAYKGDTIQPAAVLLWKAGSTTATRLPLPVGVEGKAITDDGLIVGTRIAGTSTADLAAYVWDQTGAGHALPVPAGEHGVVYAARGDWAIGNLWDSGRSVRWNTTTGAITDLGVNAPATAVNGLGWTVADNTVRRDDAKVQLGTVNGVKGDVAALSDTGTVVGNVLVNGEDGGLVSKTALSWKCAG